MLPLVTPQTPRLEWNEQQERDKLSQELQTAIEERDAKAIGERVSPQNYESLFKYLIRMIPKFSDLTPKKKFNLDWKNFHLCVKAILQQAFVDETKVALLCRELFTRLHCSSASSQVAVTCLRYGSPVVLTSQNIQDYESLEIDIRASLPPLTPNRRNPRQLLDTNFQHSHLTRCFSALITDVWGMPNAMYAKVLNLHLSYCVLSSRFNRIRVERPTALAAIISIICPFPAGVTSIIISYQASMQVTEEEYPTPDDEALDTLWKSENQPS